ncbi:carbohydrate kinase, partial [Flavobacterium sp. LBUM151]
YTYEVLERLMLSADFIKFNDEEILEISKALGSSFTSLEENIHFIAEQTHTKSICVTRGKHGALLFWFDSFF